MIQITFLTLKTRFVLQKQNENRYEKLKLTFKQVS